jgi:hypothetical protein
VVKKFVESEEQKKRGDGLSEIPRPGVERDEQVSSAEYVRES